MTDKNLQEELENNILIDKGFIFSTPFFLGRKKKWHVKPLRLGALDEISSVLLKMKLNEDELQENPLGQYKHVIKDNATLCAEVVAVSVLGKKWRIRLFKKALTSYFKWNLTPSQIATYYLKIITMADMGNFINSIRLMSGATTTKPNQIEE